MNLEEYLEGIGMRDVYVSFVGESIKWIWRSIQKELVWDVYVSFVVNLEEYQEWEMEYVS